MLLFPKKDVKSVVMQLLSPILEGKEIRKLCEPVWHWLHLPLYLCLSPALWGSLSPVTFFGLGRWLWLAPFLILWWDRTPAGLSSGYLPLPNGPIWLSCTLLPRCPTCPSPPTSSLTTPLPSPPQPPCVHHVHLATNNGHQTLTCEELAVSPLTRNLSHCLQIEATHWSHFQTQQRDTVGENCWNANIVDLCRLQTAVRWQRLPGQ